MLTQKYIPLVYSRRVNMKKVHIYLMQCEFVPAEIDHTNLNAYSADSAGVEAIKEMVRDNSSYLERVSGSIRITEYSHKPSSKVDWNDYAIQRLISNDLLEYDNVVIVYSTLYDDIITIRV